MSAAVGGRSRRPRSIALAIAAIALVVLVGGCGTDATSELAPQDKAVQLGNQLAAIHRRVAEAQRLVARQRRNALRLDALQRRRVVTHPAQAVRVVRSTAFSLDTLCGPAKPRGNSRTARQLRRQHERARRQALYFLNLSCPPTRS